MSDYDMRKATIDRLSELLGNRRVAERGEVFALIEKLKVSIGREYRTDPVFHARVRVAENLIRALNPDDLREASAYLVGLQPVLDGAFSQQPTPPPAAPPRYVYRTNLEQLDPAAGYDMAGVIHDTVRAMLRDRHERLEALCRQSLDDPQKRGVLVVREPATGEEAMTLDESVPWCTIHEYPHGRNV